MSVRKISIRNLFNVGFVISGIFFYLYFYMTAIDPIMDEGYMNLNVILAMDAFFFFILAVAVFMMLRQRTLIFKGKTLGITAAFSYVLINAAKIAFCLMLTYCFLYYSLIF